MKASAQLDPTVLGTIKHIIVLSPKSLNMKCYSIELSVPVVISALDDLQTSSDVV